LFVLKGKLPPTPMFDIEPQMALAVVAVLPIAPVATALVGVIDAFAAPSPEATPGVVEPLLLDVTIDARAAPVARPTAPVLEPIPRLQAPAPSYTGRSSETGASPVYEDSLLMVSGISEKSERPLGSETAAAAGLLPVGVLISRSLGKGLSETRGFEGALPWVLALSTEILRETSLFTEPELRMSTQSGSRGSA